MEPYELLTAATDVGFALLSHGAEIYRVEWSMRLILEAYGVKSNTIEVFAIPASIIVSIPDRDGKPLTKSRQIIGYKTDLDKLDRLNNLSRHICKRRPSYHQIHVQLNEILQRRAYPLFMHIICFGIIGFTFALFFKGNLRDAFVAMPIAALIRIVQFLLSRLGANGFFVTILCSAMAAALALLSAHLGLCNSYDRVIVGSLMTLVPGMALTNCMRDFIVGDYMTGLSHMVEALLTATAIAAGVVTVLSVLL